MPPSLEWSNKYLVQYNRSALIVACSRGLTSIVNFLLQEGANLGSADSYGYTALMWACDNGHKEIVDLLLDAGAEPNTMDQKGYTPLMMAAYSGYTSIAAALINHGANIHQRTAVSCLYYQNKKYSIELLILGYMTVYLIAKIFSDNASLYRWSCCHSYSVAELWRRSRRWRQRTIFAWY